MGEEESGTLATLKTHRRELIDPKIAEYGGRIVKTTGDGLLLEFPSVVEAVRCAVDVQRGMAERNAGIPPGRRIEFRVGINVGDIILDGEDIYGDGVNVAARLQALAEPGGICVSKVVRDQVLDKLSFGFDELGAQRVKNIARPIEVYRVELEGEPTRPRRNIWLPLVGAPRSWIVVGVLALGAAGVALWAWPEMWKVKAPPQLPHFSVAVLPFSAPGGNSADEQFADALTNDVMSRIALARASGVAVVEPSLAATYKGKIINPHAVGGELNVRYLVQGEVRRAGERIVVDTRLVDTGSATQRWSDRSEFDQTHTTQDARAFGEALGRRVLIALLDDESSRASGPLPPGAGAMDIAMHAEAVLGQTNCTNAPDCVKAMLEARKGYARALQLEPNLRYALTAWENLLFNLLWIDLHGDRDKLVSEFDDLSGRAIAIDDRDSLAWGFRADALMWQHRWPAAIEATMKESSIASDRPYPLMRRALIKLFTGRADEALDLLDAPALDPHSIDTGAGIYVLNTRCEANLELGRYEQAIAACEQASGLGDNWLAHAYLTAAYAQKGETGKAEAEKALLLQFQPGITVADIKGMRRSDDQVFLDQEETHFYAGLRKAGIPDK